jgi:hypothetical protein
LNETSGKFRLADCNIGIRLTRGFKVTLRIQPSLPTMLSSGISSFMPDRLDRSA